MKNLQRSTKRVEPTRDRPVSRGRTQVLGDVRGRIISEPWTGLRGTRGTYSKGRVISLHETLGTVDWEMSVVSGPPE